MKTYATLLCLCLLAGVLSLRDGSEAQAAPVSDIAIGEGVDEAAERAMRAFVARDYNGLWETLAPWRRNQFEVFLDKFREQEAVSTPTEDDLQTLVREFDPDGKLSLNSADRLANLTPAEWFALLSGMLVRPWNFKDEMKAEAADWKMVGREVGTFSRDSEIARDRQVSTMAALVRYDSARHLRIDLELVPTPTGWVVSELSGGAVIKFSFDFTLTEFLSAPLGLAHTTSWSGLAELRAEEARMMLASLRNQTRVQYARLGEPPPTLTACDVPEEARKWGYYEADDRVYSGRDGYDAALVAEPEQMRQIMSRALPGHPSDPWILMDFNWLGGETNFEAFPDRRSLLRALGEE